jgi:hypothetical protein
MAVAAHCFSSRDDEPGRPDQKLSASGATEDQMNASATIPQRTDQTGTKIEDLAGNGSYEAPGG